MMHAKVIKFWFEEISESQWWKKDAEFDELVNRRFSAVHQQACRCELYGWRESAEGRLAEIIVLDQFSRNIYRDDPRSFASDSLALASAQEAISLDVDQQVSDKKRSFFYLPFMHSESAHIHELAVDLYTAHCQPDGLDFELRHKAIIDRFGRYPHRNKVLGRVSTEEEIEFLSQPGSSF